MQINSEFLNKYRNFDHKIPRCKHQIEIFLVVVRLYIYNGNTITPFSIFHRLEQKIPQLQQCLTPPET